MAKIVRACPECGAPFSQHRWEPGTEGFLVGNANATMVEGKNMTVKCRNRHAFKVKRWIKSPSKGHQYELGEKL